MSYVIVFEYDGTSADFSDDRVADMHKSLTQLKDRLRPQPVMTYLAVDESAEQVLAVLKKYRRNGEDQ